MKKVMALCMAAIMVIGMSLTIFAEPGGFVSSPTAQPAPELTGATAEDGGELGGRVILTPYSHRDDLPAELESEMSTAYKQIAGTSDLTTLCADLAALAKEKGIAGKDLAVSDLFDLRYESDDPEHPEHGTVKITLGADTLDKFVALIHFNGESWELIKSAKTDDKEEHLTFSVKDFSPFAIVVNTASSAQRPPQTGDTMVVGICAAIMAVSAVGMVVAFKKSKKSA